MRRHKGKIASCVQTHREYTLSGPFHCEEGSEEIRGILSELILETDFEARSSEELVGKAGGKKGSEAY